MVFGAVNDIESLVGGLQRKIWQKISLLESAGAEGKVPVRRTRKGAAA